MGYPGAGSPNVLPMSCRLNCVDLFAGAGGLSLAARHVGIRVIAAVEMDPHACRTYKLNLAQGDDGPRVYENDIRELEPTLLRDEHFADGKDCDIVLGGPPCQGFSQHRFKNAGVADPRNSLILRYFEYVQCLQPKVFLMENVPGLLWPRHKEFREAFYRQGMESGYLVLEPAPMDARDYGVPQRRKRVFVLGIREGVKFDLTGWPPKATHGSSRACGDNQELLPWEVAAIVFHDPAPPGDENDIHMRHGPELTKVFTSTPLHGGSRRDSGRVLPCHSNGYDGHSDVYGRIDPSKPGPTMTTACINPSKGRFVHPTEPHGITLRQAARFQTFPDHFLFKGGLMAAGVQIGNAVPILLGEILLRAVCQGLGIAPLPHATPSHG